jgi:hypothetical protein
MNTNFSISSRKRAALPNRTIRKIGALFLALASSTVHGVERYVDVNNTNAVLPYTSWGTAATNIQDAVDAALAGDQILVTNGVYQTGGKALPSAGSTTNRVAVDKPVAIRSVNGPQFTLIQGFQEPGTTNGPTAIRCVYLVEGASLTGFTLTNGATTVNDIGGGVMGNLLGGGILNNCVLIGNAASYGGGASGCILNSCVLTENKALDGDGEGGGAYWNVLNNCTLTENSAKYGGGASGAQANNCLFTGNSAQGGGGAFACLLKSCTLTGNSANYGGGTVECALTNSIVYFNTAAIQGANFFYNPNISSSIGFCCTTPMPTNGIGNITNAPLFVDSTNGNFRLQSNSPCIDAGNNAYVSGLVDLDGAERVVGGTVDMGAYEWIAVPTHYVSLASPNPTPPYLSWSTAATNIQDAADAAAPGDQILVTNGIYATGGRGGSRVVVRPQSSLRSVNGPQFTFIRGDLGVRCVGLGGRASLSGFTLTNGSVHGFSLDVERGGGVSCAPLLLDVVSNCVLIGNSADQGGGAYGGTLINCTLMNNSARYGGGGAYGYMGSCVLSNCTLTGNQAGASDGGGAYQCRLINCTLTNNSAYLGGGVSSGTLFNCTLANNSAFSGAGAWKGTLRRCTLVGNVGENCYIYNCKLTGSDSYGALRCYLYNCTLTDNPIGAYGGGLWSCIVYNNGIDYDGDCFLSFCCTRVMPTNGVGNITNAPLFVDDVGGNLRLQSNSPCINAGNDAYDPDFTDLEGSLRIAGGTVDIGAFEFQSPSSVLSYAWAQQYGLPTDGSADYADPDSDGLNNWQEWIAGTVPNDASSALRLLPPSIGASGILLTWQSVTNRTYSLECSTKLGTQSAFSPVASNIVGQAGTTTYTDSTKVGSNSFYRVRVERAE